MYTLIIFDNTESTVQFSCNLILTKPNITVDVFDTEGIWNGLKT